ncbi:MAG: YceD family protein [Dehalococcoidia bacterium]
MDTLREEPLQPVVNVAQLLKEPIGSSRTRDISGVMEEEVEGFVQGKANIIRTNRGVLVQCKLTVKAELVCSRCLDRFLCPVSFAAEEEFLSILDPSGNMILSPAEQSEEFTIDSKNIVDLSELIRQYTLLSLPMKPLCRPNCSGMKEANSYGVTQEKNL